MRIGGTFCATAVALFVAVAACANSADTGGDEGNGTGDTSDSGSGTGDPPTRTDPGSDSGGSQMSGTDSGSSSSKDSGTTSGSKDSGSSSSSGSDSGSTASGTMCDLSSSAGLGELFYYEFIGPDGPCPCGAGECCLDDGAGDPPGCVPQ